MCGAICCHGHVVTCLNIVLAEHFYLEITGVSQRGAGCGMTKIFSIEQGSRGMIPNFIYKSSVTFLYRGGDSYGQ